MMLLYRLASPVERVPVPGCLLVLALYFVPLGLLYALFRRRTGVRNNPPFERTAGAA
jgi:hypothetical protein